MTDILRVAQARWSAILGSAARELRARVLTAFARQIQIVTRVRVTNCKKNIIINITRPERLLYLDMQINIPQKMHGK